MITAPPRSPLWCPCGAAWTGPAQWRCPGCGRPWECPQPPPFDPAAVDPGTWSLWRYAAMLPTTGRVTLGEGGTPLVPLDLPTGPVTAKLEFLSPTGSYKDRGTAVLVNHLLAAGATRVVADSSGNAGASLAAYAAAAGLAARVYVPAHAAEAKRRQIAALGAELVAVPGPRDAAASAARGDRTGAYASHSWHPYVLAGLATCAWEIWEQTGGSLPEVVVCPAGQGTLLLGLARGFAALRAAGLIGTGPRLVAAQAAACAPLARAWRQGRGVPATGGTAPAAGGTAPAAPAARPTRAEGIATLAPVRADDVLRQVRDSGGAVFAVAEPAIEAAERELARAGVLVEPTSAVAVAALPQVRRQFGPDASVLVPLTGSGLKSIGEAHGADPARSRRLA